MNRHRACGLSRRSLMAGGSAAAALAFMPDAGFAQDDLPLKARAARKGLVFGAAVQKGQLSKNRRFADAVLRECAILTPEWEMKWGAIERDRGTRDYAGADFIVDYALRHGLHARGHTAVWANNLPAWAQDALKDADAQQILDAHTVTVIDHFRGRVAQWDVVNEAVEPKEGRMDGLRNSILMRQLGRDFIAHAFHLAKETDPAAVRYYNDTGFWADTAEDELRRRAVLRLLEQLKRDGAPVQGLGMQAHLEADEVPFDQKTFRRFLADVASLGLEIMVTELDVNDRYVSGAEPLEVRDGKVADMTRRYLDALLDEPAVAGVVTWGLSDRYTWLNGDNRWARKDRRRNRCLPLDDAFRRKPMWYAMAAAFDGARDRQG
ncbi:MAG: endo-1,4-beta-xylanase [Flavobacteriaceae bacterium]